MHLSILPKLLKILCCHQQKIQKMTDFWHFNDHNYAIKHDNLTNNTVSLICSLSFILFCILFLHFKTLETQFHGVPLLHCVLVCKIHIYMPKMTLSSLSTQKPFFYIKAANLWYITCFAPNLIPVQLRFHGLFNCFMIYIP